MAIYQSSFYWVWLSTLLVIFTSVLYWGNRCISNNFQWLWLIENDGIEIKNYSEKNFIKLLELLANKQNTKKVTYADILSIEIVYTTKLRLSPFDFSFDNSYLEINNAKKVYTLSLDASVKEFLPQFIAFLNRKGIKVIDSNGIIELLISEKYLFDHFNHIE